MKANYLFPRVMLLLAALMWGGGFIGVQNALDHGWGVYHILAIRGLLGGSLLLAANSKTHWWKKTYLLRSGVVLGFFLFVGFALQTVGQELSTPSNSAFITALYIMIVPFILRIYKKKRIVLDVYLAMGLAMIGVGVLSFTAGFSLHLGDLLLVLGSVAFAFQIVLLEEIVIMHEPLSLAGVQLLTMGVLGLALIPFQAPIQPTGGYGGLLYISIFSSCLAFLIQAICQRIVPPATTSLLLGTESVLGSVLSVLLGYEAFNNRLLFGGLLFVAAIIICEARPFTRRKASRDENNEIIEAN